MQPIQQNNGPIITYSAIARSLTTIKGLKRQACFWSGAILCRERLKKCASLNLISQFYDEVQIKLHNVTVLLHIKWQTKAGYRYKKLDTEIMNWIRI
jgi:hypothetical protein